MSKEIIHIVIISEKFDCGVIFFRYRPFVVCLKRFVQSKNFTILSLVFWSFYCWAAAANSITKLHSFVTKLIKVLYKLEWDIFPNVQNNLTFSCCTLYTVQNKTSVVGRRTCGVLFFFKLQCLVIRRFFYVTFISMLG